MKICRQCNRTLDDSQFRPTASRSKGIRKRVAGPHSSRNICRFCESRNTQAHNFLAKLEAGERVDEKKLEQLRTYYSMLMKAGYEPITKAARRLMGLSVDVPYNGGFGTSVDLTAECMSSMQDLYEHISMLRSRSYTDVDEADAAHRRLTDRLKKTGLYEEATNLLDEWWFE